MQIGIAGNEEVLSFLQKNIKIMSSLVKGDLNYHLADYSGSIAIVIGPEESHYQMIGLPSLLIK